MRLLALGCVVMAAGAMGSVQASFPSPLTLKDILNFNDEQHPTLQLANADRQIQQANQLAAQASYDFTAMLQAQANLIEPSSLAIDRSNQDHQLSLVLQKRLYDFGRTRAALEAARTDVTGGEQQYIQQVNQHRMAIMVSFFKVLLADLTATRDNEAMSIAFIRMDRGRARNELGQLSDVDLVALENRYQQSRAKYYHSQASQRSTRGQLASLMNRPAEWVADLLSPVFSLDLTKLPDVEPLQRYAAEHNPQLLALRLQAEAAVHRVTASQAEKRPNLAAQFELTGYTRNTARRNVWQASVTLDIPLMTSGIVNAKVSQRRAELTQWRAQHRQAAMDIAQQVLETWQALHNLKTTREQKLKYVEFRGLYFDRSQALYELEFQSDLGDAMVQISDARLQLRQVEYQMMLTRANLQALIGEKIAPFQPIVLNNE